MGRIVKQWTVRETDRVNPTSRDVGFLFERKYMPNIFAHTKKIPFLVCKKG